MASSATLEKVKSLCQRRGFVFQSSDIYGGLNGVYDIGPLGVLLKKNIRHAWEHFLSRSGGTQIVFLEGALLGPQAMWQASGHLEHFHDPLVECQSCNARYRSDDVDMEKACPKCGQKDWGDVREFHMMFSTQVGAAADQSHTAHLRPETAQSIFVNFKNVISSSRVKMPFGIAQIGKAFRNEITPKQYLFRMREFEQMELEWFCKADDADHFFNFWRDQRRAFYAYLGMRDENLRIREHEQDELAHYSTATVDIEYYYPFGWKELEGVAYRGNYDLRQHSEHSGKDLSVYDEDEQTSYIPHVIESSVGVDRIFLALLCDAYEEEETDEGERTVLRLAPHIAPIKAAILPLTKHLSEQTQSLVSMLKSEDIAVQYDASGSIGKRYRRQDEIGTPFCITYDYESEQDQCVTVRHRDSMQQERIAIDEIPEYIKSLTRFTQSE